MKKQRSKEADHPNAIQLVDAEGHFTKEALELMLEHPPTSPFGQALREQALRQELFGRNIQ